MWKENKWKILVTSLIVLIPMAVGAVLWSRLPDTMAVHWGADNFPNGWASKTFAVFGMPAILLALHLFGLAITAADPRRKNIGKKPLGLVFWVVPVVSLFAGSLTYAIALGAKVNVGLVCWLLVGLVLVVLGNIMPKAKQNYSVGIKTPWALHDPENWNHTQRFGGWCMVLAGVVVMATAFWLNIWVLLGVAALAALAPMVYSYIYYCRHKPEE